MKIHSQIKLKAEKMIKKIKQFFNNPDEVNKWSRIASIIIALMAVIGFIASSCMQFPQTIDNSNRQFELMNRPFIEISVHPILATGIVFDRGILPEIQFDIYARFINHGKLPAYIKKVECIFESDNEKEFCIAMPYLEDMERQLGNIDVFPYIGEQYVKRISIKPLLNTNDIKRIMCIENDFANNIADKNSKFRITNNVEMMEEIRRHLKPFFVVIQIEYYKMGDTGRQAQPYYYSLKLRVSEGIAGSSFFKSISGETEKSGKWFKVYDHGRIERVK